MDDADRIAAKEQIVRKLERLTRQAADELAEARYRQRRRAEDEARFKHDPAVQAIRKAMREPVPKP
jgi:predicted metalloprotease